MKKLLVLAFLLITTGLFAFAIDGKYNVEVTGENNITECIIKDGNMTLDGETAPYRWQLIQRNSLLF